jgi:hypothetical protein
MFLRQSTAATIIMGPFLDITDGVTPEVGLTAGTVDEIGVYKHDATALSDLSATTTFTHRAGGMYTMTLATGDVGTLGRLTAFVRDDSLALPVWKEFIVLAANVYDSLIAGGDNLDVISVGLTAISNDVITAAAIATGAIDTNAMADGSIKAGTFAAGAINTAAIGADAIGASEFGQDAADKVWSTPARAITDKAGFSLSSAGIQAIWDALLSALTTASTIGKKLADLVVGSDDKVEASADVHSSGQTVAGVTARVTANADQINGDATAAANLALSALGLVNSTALTGTLSTTQMTTNLTEVTDDHYIGRIIVFRGGVLDGQATDITDYDGASKMLTFTALTEAPVNGQAFTIC